MDATVLATYSVAELCEEYLAEQVDTDILETFRKQKITGSVFLDLEEQQLVD